MEQRPRAGPCAALRRPADRGEAGHARARRRRARRGPGDRRADLREPVADAAARPGGDARRSARPSPWSCGSSSFPRRTRARAARDLARLRRRDPRAVSFCHQSPWHVPIRWFVLFRDEERRLSEDEHGPTPAALPHADAAGDAPRRARGGAAPPFRPRAHQRPHRGPAPVDGRVRPGVDPGARLRRLCDLMTWDELDDDHSAPRDPRRAGGAGARGVTRRPPTSTRACSAAGPRSAAARS